MSRQRSDKAYGPYEHGKQWRVVIIRADGARGHRNFEDHETGKAYVDSFAAISNTRTLVQAVGEYLAAVKDAKGVETTRHRLNAMLQLPEQDRRLMAVTAQVAQRLYNERKAKVAVATHHGELAYCKRFFTWCIGKGWLRTNPFGEVKAEGTPNRGKPKLRIDASRKFMETVLANESVMATAVLTAFMLAMRATEVMERKVRDLDDNGRLLWITDAKSRAGDREILIPDLLQPRLMMLTAGKGPDDFLFQGLDRHALYRATVRFCKDAGVARVTPHGLRGSGATNAVALGGRVEDVARFVGHADAGTTLRRHYLGAGAESSARGRQMEELLVKDPAQQLPNQRPDELN